MKSRENSVKAVGLVLLLLTASSTVLAQTANDGADVLNTNKQTVRTLFESVWNERNFDLIEDLWAPEVPFHIHGATPLVTHEGLRNQVSSHFDAFPDFHFVIGDIIAEGDLVAARVSYKGTHTGSEWFGLPATGKSIDVTEMMFFRLADGVVVEAWEDYDEYGKRRQLGAL